MPKKFPPLSQADLDYLKPHELRQHLLRHRKRLKEVTEALEKTSKENVRLRSEIARHKRIVKAMLDVE